MICFKAPSRFVVLSLVVLAIIVFSEAGCQQQAGPPEKITIAYSTASNAILMYIAFAKDYFAQEGLDATPQPHAFGKPALQGGYRGEGGYRYSWRYAT